MRGKHSGERSIGPGIWPLENTVRSYAWGSRTFLAELLGRPSPAPEPEAELWMGAHARAPSQVCIGEQRVPLPQRIDADPAAVLGASVAARFGGQLPFLLKVLAVETALSIQAHPDAGQASDGFRREEAAGIDRDAPERCYPDPGHKPELVCALGRFRALRGFLGPDEIARRLSRLGIPELAPPERGDPGDALRGFLERLLGLEPDRRRAIVERAVDRVRSSAADDPDLDWIPRLQAQHPGDVGVLAPAFLHLVELAPGEAMFLPARELHCYLEGPAVELMANSDNVLRGGLTKKHVDAQELLRILDFEPARFDVLRPSAGGVEARYETPAREFRLSRVEPRPGRPFEGPAERSVEIWLCVEGEARLRAPSGDAATLARGASALLPAGLGAFRVEVEGGEGEATLYRAGVPDPGNSSSSHHVGGDGSAQRL